mmetsp:Transcript_121200/g.342948  ORF Transcript_121200/g.342948 Transcript_121200/m.342948 type:complete len:397 (-) Transcript_121200:46-1236(-)
MLRDSATMGFRRGSQFRTMKQRRTVRVLDLVCLLATEAGFKVAAADHLDHSVADHKPRVMLAVRRWLGPRKQTYYEDFRMSVTTLVPHCTYPAEDSDRLCPWRSGSVREAGDDTLAGRRVVFMLDHRTTNELDTFQDNVMVLGRELRDVQTMTKAHVGVLICLNKVYTLGCEKLRVACRVRDSLGVPVVVLTWSPRLLQQCPKTCSNLVVKHVGFAVDPELFHVQDEAWEKRAYDVAFTGHHEPPKYLNRDAVLQALKDSHIIVYNPTKVKKWKRYQRVFSNSRIMLSTIGLPPTSAFGHFDLVGTRYFEIMASGTVLLLCDRSLAYRDLGIVENVTAAMFSTPQEAVRVVRYYLGHPAEASVITQAARNLVLANHTWKHRAREVLGILEDDRLWR